MSYSFRLITAKRSLIWDAIPRRHKYWRYHIFVLLSQNVVMPTFVVIHMVHIMLWLWWSSSWSLLWASCEPRRVLFLGRVTQTRCALCVIITHIFGGDDSASRIVWSRAEHRRRDVCWILDCISFSCKKHEFLLVARIPWSHYVISLNGDPDNDIYRSTLTGIDYVKKIQYLPVFSFAATIV